VTTGRASLAPVPSLDELAADPTKATALPADARQTLALRAVAVLAALAVAPVPANPGLEADDGDRLLSVGEAAQRLGVSSDWVYRRVGKLPFVLRLGRTVRCSAAGIDRYIRQRAGR
jgi:excisionase family DNA binding protein